jgi:dTDP-4-amino-4,6-dideoxygalactose transaminase
MLNGPLSPWPSYTQEEIDAVSSIMASNRVNYWTGQECREFEREFASWCGTHHAIALANGTLALDLALKALGIGPGDEVIVTPRTFIASVSCVINAGATPVFADVCLDSGNITAATVADKVTPQTRAIIPVHLAGWPCDMPEISAFAQTKGLNIIEDCAQAHGAMIDGLHVGSWSDVAAWSFCQDKIITTGGEGGIVTTDDQALWSKMWSFKDHGKDWDAVYNRQHPPGFRWVHEGIGTNWRMLEMQATIGRIQLKRMAEWTKRRTYIAGRIHGALRPFANAVRTPLPRTGVTHAFYRFYAYVRPEGLKSGWTRDAIAAACTQRGAPVLQGSCSEIYREKAFDGTPWRPAQRLPNAAQLGETSLMFLTHPTITDEQIECYTKVIGDVFREAST